MIRHVPARYGSLRPIAVSAHAVLARVAVRASLFVHARARKRADRSRDLHVGANVLEEHGFARLHDGRF